MIYNILGSALSSISLALGEHYGIFTAYIHICILVYDLHFYLTFVHIIILNITKCILYVR